MTTFGKLLVLGGVLGIAAVAGAYVYFIKPTPAPVDTETATTTSPAGEKLAARNIIWKITPTDDDAQGTPHNEVSVTVDGQMHVIGTFAGNCQDIATGNSVGGSGLLAGELSAVQCYWAGSGDEIGVFAHEDGGYQIMVGEIGEPTAETPAFRGNFKIKVDIPD